MSQMGMGSTPDAVALKLLQEAQQKLDQYQKRVENLETCVKITSSLIAEQDLNVLLETIMTTAKKVMDADACSILLLDEETGELVFQVALSEIGQSVKEAGRVKLGQGIAGSVARTGEPIAIRDAYSHPKFDPTFDQKTGFSTGSLVCAPLGHKGKVVGVCEVMLDRNKGRAFTNDDLPLFQMICNSAALAIQNALSIKTALKNQLFENDMAFALSVQQGFLPKPPADQENFMFAAKTVPGRIVGGDFYDFIPLDAKRLGIVVGDVSGKGVSAALHMARLMSDFRFMSQLKEEPKEVLEGVNGLLCERSTNGVYATAVYLLLDLKKKKMTVANSGHPSPILQLKKKLVVGESKASGAPLGIMPAVQYKEEKYSLEPGDRVFLYSDGVTGAKSADNIPFGLNRLCDILNTNKVQKPSMVIRYIEQSMEDFRANRPQSDDWTFLGFQTL